MKYAICAASGQLGSAIVKALLEKVEVSQVVALARTPEKAQHLGVEVRKGDYTLKSDFDTALQDIDAVLLLSANGEPMGRVPQHRNVIEAAKEAGVKKIVYTSISGNFGPVVKSNRATEEDVKASGLDYAIGRNGIYIEPDLEYIETYKRDGKITNSAGDGKCAYTTRAELAAAYANLLVRDDLNGKTYTLAGEPITQTQLTNYLNQTFETQLVYEPMTVEAYEQERKAELGEFLGGIIAAIYASIRRGDFDTASNFEAAAGRAHMSWEKYFEELHKSV
ncbi:MAG: SDR family oxidoreductase [Bacteroidota bacterium]